MYDSYGLCCAKWMVPCEAGKVCGEYYFEYYLFIYAITLARLAIIREARSSAV
jgi:hypothetical protein